MFKLIVGLGNPGRQYQETRHNAGFWFLEGLALEECAEWRYEPRFQGSVASFLFKGERVLLLKPATFMNKSGCAVGKIARYYNIRPVEILVAHDEMDFDVGVIKLKKNGGHGGHNGLRDVIAHLGAKDFCRLRVGVGRPPQGYDPAGYVLSEPSKNDKQKIEQALLRVYEHKDLVLSGRLDDFMNLFH